MALSDELLLKMAELVNRINVLETKVNELETLVKGKNEAANTEGSSDEVNTKKERYSINGEGDYKKGKLVLAIVKDYTINHKGIGSQELIDAFPASVFGIGKYNCVIRKVDIPEKQRKKLDPDGKLASPARYFEDDDLLIVLEDGTEMAVLNQWDHNTINNFIDFVTSKYNYNIKNK